MRSLMQRIDPSYKETLLLFEDKVSADEIRQKYYQDIDRRTFDAAVKSDPTAKVYLNGKYNFINRNGEIAFPEQWYDNAWSFSDGYAVVTLDDKWYLLRKDGVLCDRNTKQPIEGGNRLEEAIDRVIKRMLQ